MLMLTSLLCLVSDFYSRYVGLVVSFPTGITALESVCLFPSVSARNNPDPRSDSAIRQPAHAPGAGSQSRQAVPGRSPPGPNTR